MMDKFEVMAKLKKQGIMPLYAERPWKTASVRLRPA